MKLYLERIQKSSSVTIGKLYKDGRYFCDTLEDVVRLEKIKGETAIPAGTYEIAFSQSEHFKCLMPYLLDVPNFKYIMIHNGNNVKHTEGCILVGKHYSGDTISHSIDTFDALYDELIAANEKKERITIQIT